EWQRFVTLVKQSQELKHVSYHKLYDIVKQHQHEVNEIRAEKIARVANPLALVAQQQQQVYHPQTHPTHYNQHSSTRTHQAATRNRGKADNSLRIHRNAGYESQRSGTVAGARETVGSSMVQKFGIQCYNCKEYGHVARECQKPKRTKDAAYHREKMLLSNVHNNDDDNNVFANERQHPEQPEFVNDTYLVEQGDTNITLASSDMSNNEEKADHDDQILQKERELLASLIEQLKIKTDETKQNNKSLESSNQALREANTFLNNELKKYKDSDFIQEVTPDAANNFESIFDVEPLQKVQSDNDEYNVFDNERQPTEQPESIKDTYLNEQGDTNITTDSVDMSTNREEADQDDDDLTRQRDLLASLIENLKCEIDDSKNHNKLLESSNKILVDKLKSEIEDFKNKNKCLESSNNYFKEANTKLAKNNQLMFKDLKKFQAELDSMVMASSSLTPNFDTINLLSKYDIVTGFPKLKFVKDHLCSFCGLGKAKHCGPMRVESFNGKKYVLVIVDGYSRYTWTHFLRSKDETHEVLIDFLKLVQRGLYAQTLHAYFATEGIQHQTSVARTPEQNGVVERRNRTLVEAPRTMLSSAKVPLFFWAEAIATACFTQNRSLVIPRHEKTPYHIINERKPLVKFFHIFGSVCYIVRDWENLDKMKEIGDECIFVGYSTQSRAYRVYNKRTRVIMESIHVNFDELPQMASAHNSSDPAPTCQTMESVQISSDPAPESRISNFYTNFQVDEIGRVVSVGDGIARVYGLNEIQAY
nr:retrovirus-related Pol polyprotein from transposon TNT 1-94 [Tanacetum cinerariifolium]